MKKILVSKAEKLAEKLSDVEDALGRCLDAACDLADSEIRGEEREEASSSYYDALADLESAVASLRASGPGTPFPGRSDRS